MARFVTVICKVHEQTILKLNGNDFDNNESNTDVNTDANTDRNDDVIDLTDGDSTGDAVDGRVGDGRVGEVANEEGVVVNVELDNGINSVRSFVRTTRKSGKVWHQCVWSDTQTDTQTDANCKYGTRFSGAMVNHIRSHLKLKPFKCNICGKDFTISCNLKSHLRIHHNLKAKIMANKRNNFANNTSLESIKQNDINDSELKDRDKTNSIVKFRIFKPHFINDDSVLSKHLYSEDGNDLENNFQTTDDINKEKTDIFNATKELKENVGNDDMKIENFKVDNNIQQLIAKMTKTVINMEKVLYLCRFADCNYETSRKTSISFHIKKHVNYRPFKCSYPECGASFIQMLALRTHALTHTNDKTFKCNLCSFSTHRLETLKMHRIKHTKIKRFVCSHRNCKAKFSCKVSLIRHSRVHLAGL